MRYIEKKMKLARVNLTLKIVLIFLSVFSLWAFSNGTFGQYLNEWRFQFYLLGFLGILYAANYRFFLYSFLFFLIWVLNFFVLSSAGPIFFASSLNLPSEKLVLGLQSAPTTWIEVFDASENINTLAVVNPKLKEERQINIPANRFLGEGSDKGSFVISDLGLRAVGKINFGKNNSGVFAETGLKDKEYMIIMFDWSDLSHMQRNNAFKILNKFVAAQDCPIIIMGNFAEVAWNKEFSDFLSDSGLEIKNPLMSSVKNLFMPTTEYVIGYHNLEFDKDDFIKTQSGKKTLWRCSLKI